MTINKTSTVIFIHQQKHVGGGQTYVNGLMAGFKKKGFRTQLVEGKSVLEIVQTLIYSKSKYIIWSIYDEFPIFPFIVSCLLGKKNILVIYGIWKLESRSLFVDNGNFETKSNQQLHELKLLLKQFTFALFSSYIVHLSKYAESLFFSVKLFQFFKYKKNIIIYGGVDRKVFKKITQKSKNVLRQRLGIRREDTILLMVGRVEKRKNFNDGIKILKKIRRIIPKRNFFLYIVASFGNFNDYRFMNRLLVDIGKSGVGEYVRIVSGITTSKVAKFYQISDAYLMLSKELETFGLVTLEALYSGIPVFGYHASATSEILTDKENKWLVKTLEPEKVARLIAWYLERSNTEKKQIFRKLSLAISRFTWTNAASKIAKELK